MPSCIPLLAFPQPRPHAHARHQPPCRFPSPISPPPRPPPPDAVHAVLHGAALVLPQGQGARTAAAGGSGRITYRDLDPCTVSQLQCPRHGFRGRRHTKYGTGSHVATACCSGSPTSYLPVRRAVAEGRTITYGELNPGRTDMSAVPLSHNLCMYVLPLRRTGGRGVRQQGQAWAAPWWQGQAWAAPWWQGRQQQRWRQWQRRQRQRQRQRGEPTAGAALRCVRCDVWRSEGRDWRSWGRQRVRRQGRAAGRAAAGQAGRQQHMAPGG